jgi:hypothetical protein
VAVSVAVALVGLVTGVADRAEAGVWPVGEGVACSSPPPAPLTNVGVADACASPVSVALAAWLAVGSTVGSGLGVASGVRVGGGNGFRGRAGLTKIAVYRPHKPSVATRRRPLRTFHSPPPDRFRLVFSIESLMTAEF